MSDTIRVTLIIEGNQHGYFVDADDMAQHVSRWIVGALFDRYDIQAWSTTIENGTP